METPTKPLRGMDIIRRLVEVKKQAQRDAVETYRNNPEIRAIYDRSKEKIIGNVSESSRSSASVANPNRGYVHAVGRRRQGTGYSTLNQLAHSPKIP